MTNTYPTEDCLKRPARDAAVLAFLGAWRQTGKRDQACADAFKAYLAIDPNDRDTSKRVIEALIEMIKNCPDWSEATMPTAPPSTPTSKGRETKPGWRSRRVRDRRRFYSSLALPGAAAA